MPLKLTITSYQRLSPGQETTKILDRGSISIGRAAQNDWVLQDPERILSKNHCTVQSRDGGYFLTDLSVNGTFLNDSEQRIARDQTVELHDGDHFVLGEYEIAVALLPTGEDLLEAVPEGVLTEIVPMPGDELSVAPHPPPDAARERPGLDVAPSIAKPSFSDILAEDQDSLGLKHRAGSRLPGAPTTEPAPDLSKPERVSLELPSLISVTPTPLKPPEAGQPVERPLPPVPARPEPEAPAQPPPEIPESPAVTPPATPAGAAEAAPEPLIPEDWWLAPPTPPAVASMAPPPDRVPAPPSAPRPPSGEAIEAPRPAPAIGAEPTADTLLRAFLDGAGLSRARVPADQLPEIMASLGAILRETVRGLMEILLARGDVKGEFRLDRTAIGPMENNPLKTPPGRPPLSPEEVMILLLIRRQDAYMSPVQAVREGFNDIKAHQLAVMAGIQAALNRLLARFDPRHLETRLEQSVLDNLWPANRKAKYWDLFTAEYQAIAREAEDDFNELFGNEFARAYEARLRRP